MCGLAPVDGSGDDEPPSDEDASGVAAAVDVAPVEHAAAPAAMTANAALARLIKMHFILVKMRLNVL